MQAFINVKGSFMPSDFRIELSDESMTIVEKLLSSSKDATSFKLARPLQLNCAQGVEVISLPQDTEIMVWDRMKGSYWLDHCS